MIFQMDPNLQFFSLEKTEISKTRGDSRRIMYAIAASVVSLEELYFAYIEASQLCAVK
jgi:hypothetical protein